MEDTRWLDTLTPAQREAVEHIEGPLLILAGPGSGKTRVVTCRIANLLRHGIRASSILALTFTNKAAAEMQQRVGLLAPGQPVWVSTFHRFCARLLRQHGALVGLPEHFTIYDTADSQQALRAAMESLRLGDSRFTPQEFAAGISWAKNHMVLPDDYEARPGSAIGAIIARVYPEYQQRLLASAAVDFDDLLLHVVALLRDNPELRSQLDERYQYVLVDEYQDTNLAQYAIVRGLSVDYRNLAVTGDPDQSIYGWRGANLSNILEFERDFPDVRVVRLEQNYRSTKRILQVASTLIARNRRRKEKALFTDNAEGPPVRLVQYESNRDEAEGIAAEIAALVADGQRRPRDFAVFYRTNALSRWLEFALREMGVPYQVVRGMEFFQRAEIKDVLAYLNLLSNPRNDVAWERTINTPPRGIGRSTVDRLKDYASQQGISRFEASRQAGLIESLPKRSAVNVARFVGLFDHLTLVGGCPVEEILGHVLEASGYRAWLELSESEESQERLANIEELLTVAREFDERSGGEGSLEQFLEEMSLVSDTDTLETTSDTVTLMTLHASKGLEFPAVYIVALEEGILPHERSRDDERQLEEERRLLFVGITRARQQLQLSNARVREFRGLRRMTVVSPFVGELPLDEMEVRQQAAWAGRVGRGTRPDEEIPWETDPWDDPPEAPARQSPRGTGSRDAAIITAAALAGRTAEAPEQPAAAPEEFAQGMIVQHPEYGLGKVVALSGSGNRRKATVAFVTRGMKTFVLAQCPLQPVRSR